MYTRRNTLIHRRRTRQAPLKLIPKRQANPSPGSVAPRFAHAALGSLMNAHGPSHHKSSHGLPQPRGPRCTRITATHSLVLMLFPGFLPATSSPVRKALSASTIPVSTVPRTTTVLQYK
ncbi:hypothetical protein BS50DRAFT_351199 [Corynespora cassiicola Philippines]|uniref:Uncharacterized protein n=1 Tax=Corynespora cassiicola Philippines TaxID=1448308 RepID=A0A2T2NR44_CORCC|nr:hypothetical protein BS50DRAFT_351199 [Corynespora cassiicola Philippines]